MNRCFETPRAGHFVWRLFLAVCLIMSSRTNAQSENLEEIKTFLKPADFELVSISPTSRYLAVASFSDEGRRLQVRDRRRNEETVNYDLGQDYAVRALSWATDDLLLVQQNRRSRSGSFFGSRDLITIEAANGKLERIGRGEVIDILDGKRALIISDSRDRFSEAHRLDAKTGIRRRLARSASTLASFIPDEAGKIRFSIGFSRTGDELVHVRKGRDWSQLASNRLGARGWEPWWFTGKPDQFFTRTSEGGGGAATWGLGLYDAKTRTHRLLFRHPKTDVTDLLYDYSRHHVIAVGYELHYPTWKYVDGEHRLTQMHVNLRRAFRGKNVDIVSVTRDHGLAVVLISSDVNPGDYYLVNTTTTQADKLFSRRPDLADRTLAPMSGVEIKASDGTTLYGYTTSHPDTPVPGPLVVLVHGGPYGIRDRWRFEGRVQLLANRGYHVLQINFRGSGGYGVDYLAAGIGEWGGLMQDDVTDATRWATSPGSAGSANNPHLALASADRICIMGTSYGAYAAMMGPIKAPGLYRCAIGTAGVYDMTLMSDSGDIRRTRAGSAYLSHVLGQSEAALKAISPTHRAAEIKVPVLLIHGDQDFRAPLEHAKGLRKALTEAGNPPAWHKLAGEGHGTSQLSTLVASQTQVLRFLQEHLSAR
jgi:dipeptidyl aminopeptidase/acylaminoacyl peptidase